MSNHPLDRRSFLHRLGSALVPLVIGPPGLSELAAMGHGSGVVKHPDPRPGVDGSRVLAAAEVTPHVAELFDAVREIPGVVDGIGCHCGCAELPGMYSLLSCYEGAGMAQYCEICQGEGRLAVRLHGEGLSLDGIRERIDRRFG